MVTTATKARTPAKAPTEQFEVRNRWTNAVQFTAEISCAHDASVSVKLGLAVLWGRKNDANLSGAYLRGANLRGADLSGAYLRDANLRDADLSGAYLRGANLRGADLSGAYLRDANLRDADLRGANLRGADLSGAYLRGANLRGADLSECPVKIPDIHKAVYEAASAPGALDMGDWHTCETTHCRAGWVVTLAGDGGRALEWAMGTPAAAAMIYLASDPDLEKMPDFYASNDAALADMKALAEKSA